MLFLHGFYFDDLSDIVGSTNRASLVRRLKVLALRTNGKVLEFDSHMAPAVALAGV